jgi:hypothetical protein
VNNQDGAAVEPSSAIGRPELALPASFILSGHMERLLLVFCLVVSIRADWSVKTTDTSAPPETIAEPLRAALSAKAIQLTKDGQATLDLWLRKEVPLKNASPTLNSIPEAALVGAIVLHTTVEDYKGNNIPKGTYTARFAQQPQDGDHLGTAEHTTFLVLVPVSADQELAAFTKYTPLVKASGKIIPSGHPAVINLRSLSKADAAPTIVEPAAEHRALRLKIPGKTGSGEKAEIAFDLVFEGKGGMH